MGNRPVLWTDPNELDEADSFLLAPPFQYRYVLGDTTDLSDSQDNTYTDELLR